jgi:hypothetical protein
MLCNNKVCSFLSNMNRFKTNQIRTYEIPNYDANTFNPIDIVSGVEQIDIETLQKVIMSKYLPLAGGSIYALNIESALYVQNQAQSSFTATELAKLNTVDDRTNRLSYTGSKTILSGNVDITGALSLGTRLNATSVGNGDVNNTKLSYLNASTEAIQPKLNALQTQTNITESTVLSHSTSIATHTTELTGLQGTVSSHTATLTTHTTDIEVLHQKTQGITNSGGVTLIQDLRSSNVDMTKLSSITQDVQMVLNTNSQAITFIESNIVELETSLQNTDSVVQTHKVDHSAKPGRQAVSPGLISKILYH